eukprot:133467-Pelagomonas_calceolata.AAC.3
MSYVSVLLSIAVVHIRLFICILTLLQWDLTFSKEVRLIGLLDCASHAEYIHKFGKGLQGVGLQPENLADRLL